MKLYHLNEYILKPQNDGSVSLFIRAVCEDVHGNWTTETFRIHIQKKIISLLDIDNITNTMMCLCFGGIAISIRDASHSLVLVYDDYSNRILQWSYG